MNILEEDRAVSKIIYVFDKFGVRTLNNGTVAREIVRELYDTAFFDETAELNQMGWDNVGI